MWGALWWLGFSALVAGGKLIQPPFDLLKRLESNNGINNSRETNTTNRPTTSHPIIKKLLKLQRESPFGIINVDEEFAKEFVFVKNRPYTFIFIASADGKVCPYCSELRKHLEAAAPFLLNSAGDFPIVDEHGVPVFLVEVMANRHRGLAKFLDLQGVPSMALLNPHTLKCYNSENKQVTQNFDICRIEDQNVLALRTAIQDTSELVASFHRALGRQDITAQVSKAVYYKKLTYLGILALTIGTVGLYFFEAIRLFIIHRPQIIATVALFAFFVSTSGLIYNLQHNMEFFGYNWQKKESVWIAPQARQQYVAEGLFFSGTCVIGSMCFYCGVKLPHFLSKRSAREFWAKRKMWINAAVILLMMIGIGAYKMTRLGIHIKRLSASPPFFPEGMTKGSVRVDRMYGF